MDMSEIGHNSAGYRDHLVAEARRLDREIRERASQLHGVERELRNMRTIMYDLPRFHDADEIDLIRRLKQAVSEAGGQAAFAKLCQVSRQYLHDCLESRRRPSRRILNQIGLRRIEVYVSMTDEANTSRSVSDDQVVKR
jgi:DNA-binding phage protein